MIVKQEEQITATITRIIREKSGARQLVQADEVLLELNRRPGLPESAPVDHDTPLEPLIRKAMDENEDLMEIAGPPGTLYYYSAQSLNETYAELLVRKEEGPLPLIAQIVRDNSVTYPRPVPLDIFTEAPFDLTEAVIEECLKSMGEQIEYQDIAQTLTSVGTTFLYSNRYLDPDHASMLAEWLDVGQANNP
jgi:hypothetical protein